MLSIVITLNIMPVNAQEVSVTFDEGRLCTGQEIGNTYSDMGITFSPGVKLVNTDCSRSKQDMGFWNPNNRIIKIYFSPAVRSVSITFEDALAGNMDAILVNGKVLSRSESSCSWAAKKTLKIKSNNADIKSISISSKSACEKKIKFDNLCYEQVTEISENPSCGNDTKPDDICPVIPEEPPCGNDTRPDDICPVIPEEPPCGNDTRPDDICPVIPEKTPCGNDTRPDDTCPIIPEEPPCENDTKPDDTCNEQIPEFPTIAIPMATLLGMMFIFNRRKN